MSLAEIREKMNNSSPKKKPGQKTIANVSMPSTSAEEGKTEESTVEEVVRHATEMNNKETDLPSKPDAESVEEASDKENTSAAANIHDKHCIKPLVKESPAKPKSSLPSKVNSSAVVDKKQQTLASFFKPSSTSPLKRKREEDGGDDDVQGKAKQLKTHA